MGKYDVKKILLISDTHFSKNNELLFKIYDVEKSFNQLKNRMLVEEPDFIFVIGDISQDGSKESYIKARDYLSLFKCPKYIIMGNHDSENIKYMLNENIQLVDYLDVDNHRFIFLSSYKGYDFGEGYINQNEMNKIDAYVNNSKQNYLLIHHHFIKTNSIMDNYILENHLAFCKHIIKFNVKAIFHGHVHNDYKTQLQNTIIYANPSTCVTFDKTDKLKLIPKIGFRIINLLDDKYDQLVIIESIQ